MTTSRLCIALVIFFIVASSPILFYQTYVKRTITRLTTPLPTSTSIGRDVALWPSNEPRHNSSGAFTLRFRAEVSSTPCTYMLMTALVSVLRTNWLFNANDTFPCSIKRGSRAKTARQKTPPKNWITFLQLSLFF